MAPPNRNKKVVTMDGLHNTNSTFVSDDIEAENSLQRSSRGIVDSMKNMWKKMRSKQGSGDWDLSREEASELYQKYYDCVGKRYDEARKMQKGLLKPVHAVMALEGERVTMKCKVW